MSGLAARMDRRRATANLTDFVVNSVKTARESSFPFFHLEFDRVFPDDLYDEMMRLKPAKSDYRKLPGRDKGNIQADGTSTRIKIDLFPEYIRHMPAEKHRVWDIVGRTLCSTAVKEVFVRRLAPGLERRFGADFKSVGLFPIPVLTRDFTKYWIHPHTDTQWKGITVQLYLPNDNATKHIGTIFHEKLADGTYTRAAQMPFSPNSGYAFAVGTDTWHSADPVGPEVETRDSILLTYFVDAGVLRFFRNRGKRVGNFVLNEARHLTR